MGSCRQTVQGVGVHDSIFKARATINADIEGWAEEDVSTQTKEEIFW